MCPEFSDKIFGPCLNYIPELMILAAFIDFCFLITSKIQTESQFYSANMLDQYHLLDFLFCLKGSCYRAKPE